MLPFVAFVALTATFVAALASFAGTDYAVGKRVGKTPRASVVTRFAQRLVQVKRGTKRARAFTLATGATALATIGPVGVASCPARWHITVRRSPVAS